MHVTHAVARPSGRPVYLVDEQCHPQTIAVVRTRAEARGFWTNHRDDVLLALLFVYVILLGIGTAAELFHIDSILRWPIYR